MKTFPKIKKVLLINPRSTISQGSIRRLPTPLGLMYLACVLEEKGYSVSIMDALCEGYENVVLSEGYQTYGLSDKSMIRRIHEESPDFVGITCNFSNHESEVRNTARLVKSVDRSIITCAGGLHPSCFAKEMLDGCADLDFIILREGERRLCVLVDAINKEACLNDIEGLALRDGDNVIVNEALTFIDDLDALPFPARHLIDMEKYIDIGLFSNPFPKRERMAQVLTSRGCPYNCFFCATKPYWGGKFRKRSADNILSEIRLLKEQYQIEEIQFRDDNIFVDRKRSISLLEGMKEFDMCWCAGIMIKNLDEPMIKLMAESGCYKLTISIESGSPRVLRDVINKPIDLDSVKTTIDAAHKYGIYIHADNVIGMPGETRHEMEQTFEFNKMVGCDSAAFFIAAPYVGSPLYELCKERGWLDEASHKMDFKKPGIHIKPTDKEYVMPEAEMVELVERKTKEHNEWSKKQNPELWESKFSLFLKKHGKEKDKLMGRVV